MKRIKPRDWKKLQSNDLSKKQATERIKEIFEDDQCWACRCTYHSALRVALNALEDRKFESSKTH